MKKILSLGLTVVLGVSLLASCEGIDSTPLEGVESSAVATEESGVDVSDTAIQTEETKVVNPNNLPVYEAPEVITPTSCLEGIELDDETMSELLDTEMYPFRTSYGFGFDSPYTTEYVTSFINEKYGTSYEVVNIDDVNFYNTNHYHIAPELFDADAVNRLIWFSYYSGSLDCDFDCFMVNRAIMLSLGLVPMVDEIPYEYIAKYAPITDVTLDELHSMIDDYLHNGGRGLTEDELTLVEILKYNISFHDILNWRYDIPLGRRTDGTICMLLTPNLNRYQGVIDGCASLGVDLNTEMEYYAPKDVEVRVIIPDTPEYFEQVYGRTYESVLEEYGLPLNPEI